MTGFISIIFQLDPLKPEIGRRPAANSSLVPVSRRRSGDEPASVLIEKPRTDSDDIHESSAKPNDDTHSDPGPHEEEIIPTLTEETPLLGLPAPYEDPYLWRRALRGIFVTRIPRKLWARTIKSCILVAKVIPQPKGVVALKPLSETLPLPGFVRFFNMCWR